LLYSFESVLNSLFESLKTLGLLPFSSVMRTVPSSKSVPQVIKTKVKDMLNNSDADTSA